MRCISLQEHKTQYCECEFIKTAGLTWVAVIMTLLLQLEGFSTSAETKKCSRQGELATTQNLHVCGNWFPWWLRMKLSENMRQHSHHVSLSGVFSSHNTPLKACVLIDSRISGVCVLWLNRSCILHVLPHYLCTAERAQRHFYAAPISKVKHARASMWYILKGKLDGIFFFFFFLRAHLNAISWNKAWSRCGSSMLAFKRGFVQAGFRWWNSGDEYQSWLISPPLKAPSSHYPSVGD